jgi:hypothetical protein
MLSRQQWASNCLGSCSAEQLYQSGADAATHAATQHYAARTVENIAALGGSWAAAMADGLLINNLVSLWRGTRRATCCSAAELVWLQCTSLRLSALHPAAQVEVSRARHSTVVTSLKALQSAVFAEVHLEGSTNKACTAPNNLCRTPRHRPDIQGLH